MLMCCRVIVWMYTWNQICNQGVLAARAGAKNSDFQNLFLRLSAVWKISKNFFLRFLRFLRCSSRLCCALYYSADLDDEQLALLFCEHVVKEVPFMAHEIGCRWNVWCSRCRLVCAFCGLRKKILCFFPGEEIINSGSKHFCGLSQFLHARLALPCIPVWILCGCNGAFFIKLILSHAILDDKRINSLQDSFYLLFAKVHNIFPRSLISVCYIIIL